VPAVNSSGARLGRAKVYRRRAARLQQRERVLVEDPARLRHGLLVEDAPLLRGRKVVEESVRKRLERRRHDRLPPPPAQEDVEIRSHRGRIEREHAARRRRIERDAGASESAGEEELHEEAAERVPNQDRGFGLRLDDARVS